ncbi:MAG: serine/threonine protein phosphatase [Candidatus Bipolaricaulota bacterium]|nr:MAG: serine/threonine protein phosphatase [Candidatus Bipolaricaulota bacterium]
MKPVFEAQGRLIRLPAGRRVVYVGDTHGDSDATERVLTRFPRASYSIVFLGDAVDRGPDSRGNLGRIVRAKREAPDAVFLLMGNHEGWAAAPFTPADFWLSLSEEEAREVATRLLVLPFAAWHPSGVLALHGTLPDVAALDAIETVEPGSETWRQMTWGDYRERTEAVRSPPPGRRPVFGRNEFERIRDRLGVRLLVRSHQPDAPLLLFGDRCMTLFTSSAYGSRMRRVAILESSAEIETGNDLIVIEL